MTYEDRMLEMLMIVRRDYTDALSTQAALVAIPDTTNEAVRMERRIKCDKLQKRVDEIDAALTP